MTKTKGAREWSGSSLNFQLGCENDCRYCYARNMAKRYKRIDDDDEWANTMIKQALVNKKYGLRKESKQPIMFPTTHDITPNNFHAAATILGKVLGAGNDVLVVSKANPIIFRSLRAVAYDYLPQVEFRITIGTLDENVRMEYEPNAPPIMDRLLALKETKQEGFKTSVSAEPYLDNQLDRLIKAVDPWADTIWIGCMNHMTGKDWYKDLAPLYEPAICKMLYDWHKDNPKIRFKDAFLDKVIKHGNITCT